MINDFPRLLSLLRAEKRISQRKAAQALGISQALLSHYENGVREPGLSFIVKAADFYGVSCDYLLGRTMNRAMNQPDPETLPDCSAEKGNVLKGSVFALLQKKLLVNSLALIMDLLSKMNDRELSGACAAYFSTCLYKVYRFLYMAGKNNAEELFPLKAELFSEACDAELKHCEIRIKSSLAQQNGGEKLTPPPDLSHDALMGQSPAGAQSLFTVLHEVSGRLDKRV